MNFRTQWSILYLQLTQLKWSLFSLPPDSARCVKQANTRSFSAAVSLILCFISNWYLCKCSREKKNSQDPRPYFRLLMNFFSHKINDIVYNTPQKTFHMWQKKMLSRIEKLLAWCLDDSTPHAFCRLTQGHSVCIISEKMQLTISLSPPGTLGFWVE